MENPNNFLVNTDYPFDMIVYFNDYAITPNGSVNQTVTLPHSLGFTPLLFGYWSESEDFATTHPLSDLGGNSGLYATNIYVESDENNVYIQKYTTTAKKNTKYYLRIYGFAPISWTGDCEPTAQTNSFLLLDTDKEYAPLLAAGEVQPRRLDVQPPEPTPEQTGIYGVIGNNGYQEFSGRSANVSLYYQEPVNPSIMIWKTTSSTNRTTIKSNCVFYANGFGLIESPYANFVSAGQQGDGRMAIAISVGATRTGMPTYNDVVHFRVYA